VLEAAYFYRGVLINFNSNNRSRSMSCNGQVLIQLAQEIVPNYHTKLTDCVYQKKEYELRRQIFLENYDAFVNSRKGVGEFGI